MTDLDVAALKAAAGKHPEARLIVLFGSTAKGTAHAGSDVDVAVAGVEFWKGLQIGSDVALVLKREPHVVELEHASTWLRFEIAKYGIPLWEGAPDAWALFQARAMVDWFDFQPTWQRCVDAARKQLRREAGLE